MKSVREYQSMDISSWDQSGQGNNIIHLLAPPERKIWYKAFPYQDKRNDVGHVEHVVYFAFQLLNYIAAERPIVIPAAVLHDTGWSKLMLDGFRWNPSSDDFKENEQKYRDLHQRAGVEISQKILEEIGYPQIYVPAILEIVSQHDTRNVFFSPEDGVVRDADKLWRFSLRHWEIYYGKKPSKDAYDKLVRDIENPSFLYSDISRQIARIELKQTINYLTKDHH